MNAIKVSDDLVIRYYIKSLRDNPNNVYAREMLKLYYEDIIRVYWESLNDRLAQEGIDLNKYTLNDMVRIALDDR